MFLAKTGQRVRPASPAFPSAAHVPLSRFAPPVRPLHHPRRQGGIHALGVPRRDSQRASQPTTRQALKHPARVLALGANPAPRLGAALGHRPEQNRPPQELFDAATERNVGPPIAAQRVGLHADLTRESFDSRRRGGILLVKSASDPQRLVYVRSQLGAGQDSGGQHLERPPSSVRLAQERPAGGPPLPPPKRPGTRTGPSCAAAASGSVTAASRLRRTARRRTYRRPDASGPSRGR